MQTFSLIPYPADNLPQIQITGEIERMENRISSRYVVTGEIDSLLIPAFSASPARKHDLWRATCFEFFLAPIDQPEYWEFNLSPSGDWNVYVMDAYRQVNMREASGLTQLPFRFQQTDGELTLQISVDLPASLRVGQPVLAGITTIIQTRDGDESYWALAHPGTQADFHLRESFLIELE